MTQRNTYVVAVIMEGALMKHWSFHAADELAVARHLLTDPWEYEDVFWGLHMSHDEATRLKPEELLQAIRDSYPNNRVRAIVYLLPVVNVIKCA